MQLLSKFNEGFRFLLCVIDTFDKYAWVIPLKDKKGETIDNAFLKVLDKSSRKPNKIWVDKDSNFITILFKNGYKTLTLKCIQHSMKENLLLVKYLSELFSF